MCTAIVPVTLVTLGLGYLVLVKAAKEEGSLKQVGNVIGWIIIIVSFISLILGSFFCLDRCCSKRCYGMKEKMMGPCGIGMMEEKGERWHKGMMGRKGMMGEELEIEEEQPPQTPPPPMAPKKK